MRPSRESSARGQSARLRGAQRVVVVRLVLGARVRLFDAPLPRPQEGLGRLRQDATRGLNWHSYGGVTAATAAIATAALLHTAECRM